MKQMTRRLNILALLMILAACIPGMAFGQGSDGITELPGDPQKLLEIVDQEILTKSGMSQDFSENQGYVNEYASDSVIYALIVCSIVPILIIYPFIQKYFAKGANAGGVKE